MKQLRFNRLAIALLGFVLCTGLPPIAQAQTLNEESLKASYILKFIYFVQWERPTTNTSSIGVFNNPSLFRELSSIAEKKSNDQRAFKIIEINTLTEDLDELRGLDMIYIGQNQEKHWKLIVDFSRKESIITVGSDAGFLEAGGLIEFVTRQNRLRFSLNLIEVDSYNVGLSSKLSQLAVPKE